MKSGEGSEAGARGSCEWVTPPPAAAIGESTRRRSARILYCHGGGYTGCTPQSYRSFVSPVPHGVLGLTRATRHAGLLPARLAL